MVETEAPPVPRGMIETRPEPEPGGGGVLPLLVAPKLQFVASGPDEGGRSRTTVNCGARSLPLTVHDQPTLCGLEPR